MESCAGLIPREKFETPTSPNTIREFLLEDFSVIKPQPNAVPTSPMDTTIEDSLVGNLAKEIAVISQPMTSAHMIDGDIESTADEEDIPVQKTTRDNGHHESKQDHSRYSNRVSTTSLKHRTSVVKQRLPFEIAESPEPMQIDAAEELQVLGDMLASVANSEPGRAGMNIGGVMQDIFVGEELGDRRL